MQQGCCGYGLDPIGEAASGASLHRGPRLDPIGAAVSSRHKTVNAQSRAPASLCARSWVHERFLSNLWQS
jgi:hypothetical protein